MRQSRRSSSRSFREALCEIHSGALSSGDMAEEAKAEAIPHCYSLSSASLGAPVPGQSLPLCQAPRGDSRERCPRDSEILTFVRNTLLFRRRGRDQAVFYQDDLKQSQSFISPHW